VRWRWEPYRREMGIKRPGLVDMGSRIQNYFAFLLVIVSHTTPGCSKHVD
jgi:hypothetical protein